MTTKYLKILFLTVLLPICSPAWAQNWNMINGDTLLIDGCQYASGSIYDNGGPTGNYSDAFDGWAIIEASQGVQITITGNYTTEDGHDFINIWDNEVLVRENLSGTGATSVNCTSGRAVIRFITDGSANRSGFRLNYVITGGSSSANRINNLTVNGITTTGATLNWTSGNSGPFHVLCDNPIDDTVTTTSTTFSLTSLNPSTRHTATVYAEGMVNDRCASGTVQFRTLCGTCRLPFSEDFDDVASESAAPCWTYSVNFDDAYSLPRVVSYDNSNKVQLLSCGSNNTGGHFGMVVTPKIASDAPKWYVRFKMAVSHPYTQVVIGFCDSTSDEQASFGFTPIETISPNTNDWISYTRSYVVPSGGCRLAFRMVQSSQNGVGRLTYIDDLIIETCGVRDIEVIHPDTSSFELQWDTVGTPDVTVRVKPLWSSGQTLLFSHATSPLTVTGLTSNTRYEVVFYATCNGEQQIPSRIYANTLSADIFEDDLCLTLNTWNATTGYYVLDERWSSVCSNQQLMSNSEVFRLRNNCYLISPPLNAPGGKELMIEYNSSTASSLLVIGTLAFADDLSTFTPIDTLELENSSNFVDTAVMLPEGITDNYLVFKGLVNGNSYIGLRSLSLNRGHVKKVSIACVRSTSVTLQWEAPSTGTVYIDYYSYYTGPHYTASVTNANEVVITGLTPEQTYHFDLYLPGTSPCPYVGEVSTITARRDYDLPYCEDFEDFIPSENYGWNVRSYLYGCPTESGEYVHSGSHSLKMSAASGNNSSISALPEIDGVGGSVISFWATTMAPGSTVTVGYYAPGNYLFRPIDSLPIAGNVGWRHYWCAVPDSVAGRLALRYELTGCDGIYYVWIDDLAVGEANYADYTFANLMCTSIDVVWQAVGNTDSLTVVMVGMTDSVTVVGIPDTIHVGGLHSAHHYTCYIIPNGGCRVTAGSFNTLNCYEGENEDEGGSSEQGEGGGDDGGDDVVSPQRCNTMDDLLSYELPHGWVFSDSLLASLVPDGDGGNHLQMLSAATEGVWNTVTLPRFSYNTLYLSARGLSEGVQLAACGDTITLDTIWRSYAFPHASPSTISVSGGTGCLIDDVGQSFCPRVLFSVEGNAVTCSIAGGNRYEYILHLMDSEGRERGQHITTTTFTIEDLEPEEEYTVWWEFLYMDASCVPAFKVVTKAIPVPYCVDLEGDNYGMPAGWRATQREGQEDIGYNGTNGMTFSAGNNSWNYLILPQMESSDYLQLSLYGSFSGLALEVGHLATGTDTSSFVADSVVAHDAMNIEGMYSFGMQGIGGQRIALRYRGYCLTLRRLGVSTDPRLTFHIYSPTVLTVEAETDSSYRLGWNNNDSWPSGSIRTVHNNPHTISFGDGNLYVKQFGGVSECNFYKLFNRPSTTPLPFCDKGDMNDLNYTYTPFPNSSYYVAHTYASGRYCYRLFAGERPTVFVLPFLSNTSVANAKFSFDCMVDNIGSTFDVGVMTDLLDTATFVPVATIVCSTTGWHRQFVDLSNYSGSGRWIAIRARTPLTNGNLYISDFRVDACFLPSTTSVHVENYYQVVIEGNADSVANGPFWVEYGAYGIVPGQGTLRHFDSLPARFDLSPSSEYSLYIYCGSNRSGCSNHYHVYTLDLPLYVPSCTNFESNALNYMPQGWSAVNGPTVVTNASAHDGNRSLAIHGIAATPVIDIDTLGQAAVGFWMKATQPGAYLIVGCMTSTSSPSSFHPLRVIVPRQVGQWEYHLVSLADAPTNARHIAFRNPTSSDSHNLFIDQMLLTQCALFDMRILSLQNTSISLTWQRLGNPDAAITVSDNTTSTTTQYEIPVNNNTLTIPIIPQHDYLITTLSSCPAEAMPCAVPYADTIRIAVPADGYGCVDPSDINSPQAVFFSGTFSNPYSNIGPVNFGPLESHSRHTINTDTSARDPRTGGLLRTIPQGYSSSVRLGNWSTAPAAPEAEGVIYSFSVDTLDFSLLLMHYAAVLQNPMHAPEDQPRFRLELLDTNYNLIDPLCTAADFIANSSLGWNSAADNVLWKDWTTVGVDLSAYHGQQVYLRLTTYDCNEGSHYGYAYFTLECMLKNIVAENCGNATNNIFTAPSGFNYRWYTSTDTTTLSSAQTLVAPTSQNTTYLCDLSFVGNPSCHFTLSAFGGTRFPLARFDTLVSYSDCKINVQFLNRSTVSSDGINPVATGENAESAHWDFGNGLVSDNYHAYTSYSSPGTYIVTLVAFISGGLCSDTISIPITVDFPSHPTILGPSSLCFGLLDTLRLLNATTTDTLWQQSAAYQFLPLSPSNYHLASNLYQLTTHNSYGCTDTISHTLLVNPVYTRFDSIRICSPELPFSYADTIFLAGTRLIDYYQPGISTYGCDSSFHLHLQVSPAASYTVFDSTFASICDNETYSFYGTSYSTPGIHLVSHVDSLGRCDSLHHLLLDVRLTSAADTVALACDSFYWYGTTYTLPPNTPTPYSPTPSPTYLSTNSVDCDSTTTLRLSIYPSYDLTDSIVICQNQHFLYEGVDYGGPIAFDSPHLSKQGCDSLVHVVLYPSNSLFPAPPIVSLDSILWFPYDTTLLACNPLRLFLADTSIATSRLWTLWGPTIDTLYSNLPLKTNYLTLDTEQLTSNIPYGFQLITVSSEGCIDTVRRDSLLFLFPSPHADFIWAPDHISIHNPEIQLYNRSTPDTCSYLWLFPNDPGASSSDSSFDVDPHHLWELNTDPGEYPVSLIAYLTHYLTLDTSHLTLVCTDTATYPILIANTYLQFPNSVTPNGDGINDRWVIVNLLEMGEYSMNELWIYDRWGSLVYHVKNIHQMSDFWDPEDTRSPDGTYYYRFSAKNNFGLVKRNGVIEVSR